MFILNRKIQSLIVLACAVVMTAHSTVWAAQAPPVKPAPPKQAKPAAVSAMIQPFGFTNTDMHEFTNRMAGLLGLTPVMVDQAVQGTVDFSNPAAMSREDVFDIFYGILRSRGATLVRQNGIYQIIPISSAIRNNLDIIDELPSPGTDADEPLSEILSIQTLPAQERRPGIPPIATHVIRLDFVPVEDVVEAVRLLVSDGVAIMTFRRQNMMIITDYSDNAARIRELVRMLDNQFLDPNMVELVKIEYNTSEEIAEELGKIFGSGVGDGGATGVSFLSLDRINAIFVMAASKRGLDEAKRWIEALDTFDGNKRQTFTYVVQDSTAANIAMLLAALYGAENSTTGARQEQGTNLLGSLGLGGTGGIGSTFGSAAQLGPRLNVSSPSVTTVVLSGGEFSSLRYEARVVVDDVNNVLYIQSTPGDYRLILSDIEKMDAPPKQVLIEAQIFEVDLTSELALGFRGVLEERMEGNLTTGGISMVENSSAWVGTFRTFSYIGDSRQFTLAIDALRSKTKVRNLANPSVVAMDGNPASFVSGAEIPYPGDTIFNNNMTSQGVNYRPTGISLMAIPRISASGSVTLEVVQDVSTVAERTIAGMSAPIFPNTTVQTSFYVKDGQTVAIAGLVRDEDQWSRAGIPFLSDIPFIGALFGGTRSQNTRRELIILITPRVISTQEKFQETTQRVLDSLRNVRRLSDEYERNRIRDIEDARRDSERQELRDIQDVRAPR